MGRGRPPKGLSHVDSLEGDAAEKERLKTILATLNGDLPVREACRRLEVSESRFHELRHSALQSMLAGLAPRPPGRPAQEREPKEVQELRERVAWLEEELEISRLRTEIAMWKPSLLRDPEPPPEKKGSSSKRKGRRGRRRKRGDREGT
jgi:transposase-like protein